MKKIKKTIKIDLYLDIFLIIKKCIKIVGNGFIQILHLQNTLSLFTFGYCQ